MTRRSLARVLCLLTVVAASLAAAPGPASASTLPTFQVDFGGCWFGSVQSYAHVHVVWRDTFGHLIDSFTVKSDVYGGWGYPDGDTTCTTRPVRVGDRLRQTETDRSHLSRSFVVKPLSGKVNRTTNVLRGHASGNSSVGLTLWGDDLTPKFDPPLCARTLSTAADGSFSFHFATCHGGLDVAGGELAELEWDSHTGDREFFESTVPYALLDFGTPRLHGYTFAGTPVSAKLRSAAGATRATAADTGDSWGAWSFTFRSPTDHSVVPHVGDVIKGDWPGATTSFKVFRVRVFSGASTVRGTCAANTRYSLIVRWTGSPNFAAKTGTTNGAGSTGDYAPAHHLLRSGDHVTLTCAKSNGDRERVTATYIKPPS